MNELTLLQSILTALALAGIYVYLVASVYPWLTMHPARRQKKSFSQRGLAKVRFPEGRGIVFQPDPQVRRFLPAYTLFSEGGRKYVRLQVDKRVNYIRYDVVTYDRRGRLLDILEVAERMSTAGVTRAVRLPTATSYAEIIPRKVDGEYTNREMILGYSLKGICIYTVLTVLTSVFVGFMFRSEINYLAGGNAVGFGLTLFLSVLLGTLCAQWTVLMHYLHARRKINR